MNNTYKLKNYNDPAVEKYSKILKRKLESVTEFGYKPEDIKEYQFNKNSTLSKAIAGNEDFLNLIKEKKSEILSDKENASISFPKHDPFGVYKNNNFKNAIGKAAIENSYIDKNVNLVLHVTDVYDFNKEKTDFLNVAGKREMLENNLKPYFTIFEVLIPKKELDKIQK